MNENNSDSAHVCPICGQEREEHEMVHSAESTYCIYCRGVLREWATQIGYNHKILIERLGRILKDMVAKRENPEKEE